MLYDDKGRILSTSNDVDLTEQQWVGLEGREMPCRSLGELMDFTEHDRETEEFLKDLYHRNWLDRITDWIENLLFGK